MADKPKKLSNLTSGVFTNANQLKKYITDLDKDIFNIVTYLDRFPRSFDQVALPTLQRNTFGFFHSSAASQVWLLSDVSGTAKKVQLL